MGNVFVPYSGEQPAAVDINGHRLIILTTEATTLEEGLPLIGGDRIQCYSSYQNADELKQASLELAKTCGAGVVIAPDGIPMDDLLKNLESELPWVQ